MRLKGYKPPSVLVGVSIALNIFLWLVALITFPRQESAILHYTAGLGIDSIGSSWQIVVLPSIGTIILLLNLVLARFVKEVSDSAYWMYIISIPVIEVLLLVTYFILLRFNQ